ncbi:MAG: response regulator, partial [Rikenellaceae bacterium]
MRCLAIDDEPLALSVVEHFCSKTPSIELVATFNDSVQGLQFLKENNIDILFLDINIPHLNGIELARLLPPSVKVIFTTAYQNFAIDGFELRAVDYLLKPFSFDRFSRAVSHAIHLISLEK